MVDQKTSHLELPLPHLDNSLDQDCPRIRESLRRLDEFAKKTDGTLSSLSDTDAELAKADAELAESLSQEKTARTEADNSINETIVSLQSQLAALTEAVSKINPWDIFPIRVPIAVDGVRFGGSDGRRAIMPGETEPRENWVLCDGGSDGKDGTVPDLRGRMILGASETHQAGDTGGSETHAHSLSGTVGATTLNINTMPSHTHSLQAGNRYDVSPRNQISATDANITQTLNVVNAAGGSQAHTHTLSATSGQAANIPPYYALAYIMRTA